MTHTGSCFCGEVRFEVTGEPAAMGYCHCSSCRHWSAGPVNAFTLWKPDALKVTQGAASIGTFNKTPASVRQWCQKCGGHLFTDHPGFGLVDVYASLLPKLKFEPGVSPPIVTLSTPNAVWVKLPVISTMPGAVPGLICPELTTAPANLSRPPPV